MIISKLLAKKYLCQLVEGLGEAFLALKCGAPGATRTHDTRFRKWKIGVTTFAIQFVAKIWGFSR
jgi:hypothetical protein